MSPVASPGVAPPPAAPAHGPSLAPPGDAPLAPQRTAERPVYWLATIIGALTLLGGATALTSVLEGGSWWWPTVQVVAVITGLGIAGRLVRLPGWVVAIGQAVALCLTLTGLFTTSGHLRLIPNAAVLREVGELFSEAWAQILSTIPPAPSTVPLSFVIALSLGVVAWLLDVIIAEARAPALAALPLLCLFSIPASISPEALPWYAFVLPAAGYAVLLAVAGHGNRHIGWRSAMSMSATTVAAGGLAIVGALLLGNLFTVVGTEGRLPRTDVSSGELGLSPFTSLAGDLRRGDPVDLLVVDGGSPGDYLRTITLDTWTNNQGWSLESLQAGPLPTRRDGRTVTIRSVDFRDRFLPVYAGTSQLLGVTPSWSYDPAAQIWFQPDAINPGTYQIVADGRLPTAAELTADSVTGGGTLTEVGNLPTEVRRMAQQVTQDAAGPFAKALALQTWFTDRDNGFVYSLSVPEGNSGDLLLDFLINRTGYCEQYASAMAVMLRSLDIPARVAVGFTQGEAGPTGRVTVTSHDAHAWVEVLFDDAGWVRFDPTPLADGRTAEQGFTTGDPGTPSSSPPTSTAPSSPTTTATGQSPGNAPQNEIDEPIDIATPGGNATGATTTNRWWPIFAWALLAVAVLAAVFCAPRLVRAARHRRRLAVIGAGGPAAATLAWTEIEDLATDHGVAISPAESTRVTANRLARLTRVDEAARSRLRALVIAAELSWYSGAEHAGGEHPASRYPGNAPGVAPGSVAIAEVPGAELALCVQDLAKALAEQDTPSLLDRWWPRSMRR